MWRVYPRDNTNRGQADYSSLQLVKKDHVTFWRPKDEISTFLLYGKNGCSGDKSNGTYFSALNFSKKRNTFWGIPLFSFHWNDRKILFHLRRFNRATLPGELNAWLNAPGKHGIRVYMSK